MEINHTVLLIMNHTTQLPISLPTQLPMLFPTQLPMLFPPQLPMLFPPQPPISFPPCNFDYLSDSSKETVKDAYDAISQNELWTSFRTELLKNGVDSLTGFTFTKNPIYTKVQNAIASTDIGGLHSGYSMGFVMRVMEFIALNGEPAYKQRYKM